jgi:hypothetical protein
MSVEILKIGLTNLHKSNKSIPKIKKKYIFSFKFGFGIPFRDFIKIRLKGLFTESLIRCHFINLFKF